jgi:hypothetical protein
MEYILYRVIPGRVQGTPYAIGIFVGGKIDKKEGDCTAVRAGSVV